MDNFKDLLKLYSQKLNSTQLIIDEILEIINKESSLNLNKTNIITRDGIAYLKVKPKQKLEIILHKSRIISKFKEENILITDLK
ncbi:MAG: hypothetical protein WCV68_02850 [Candidatus Paceibacterota bacterium]|jgi:hypothetical protein